MPETLTVGSLFSGIGGLDLGLERAGMKVIWPRVGMTEVPADVWDQVYVRVSEPPELTWHQRMKEAG